ncbi:MAG TPA: tetratricopeptide repeat protein [Gordonia sp. (in: high G+C Gram-positive bacteria)]|uniref:tetratricopeptide repeat protein n=1 Tax=unclassified Gordonia (in: high G+C Gram-positive bacteria) TaxID=2657482 RepID=UPI000FB72A2C|nr:MULTISPECIES: tetratricopeptide repeat protein [unclassified Gordonia (in: high G+C Gram-positive bacteria)]RUP36770.1 MAG: tetratricopeptide repeat protein [Gordonia sp. (in: high G+C Gram-positive bacteria)]HNP56963.1 tetratricopeptide repeat protein [Gordonia sp. (in: high G+C Gram-positive bacteria)]HRC50407.1 tetratricopeptide repeat protein [Gordonia sp. (in: high G+C Gram-positive bacteria)]
MVHLDDDAIEVRGLIEELAVQLQSGDPQWTATLARARTIADVVADPRSRIDAQMRVANIDHVLSLNSGDVGAALAHLDRCLGLVAQARDIDVGEADHRRLDEQEWGLRLNRCQVLQAMDDIDGADAEVVFALELASNTTDAQRNRAMTLCSVAAIAVEREQWGRALRFAGEAVDECAAHSPESLGVALLNLAQSHARIGDYDEAERVADRAEGVVEDVSSQAALAHLRGYIAMGRKDAERAAELFGEYAATARAHADFLEPHHRSESAKALGIGLHAHDPDAAREHFLAVVEQERGAASPMTLVAALIQASGATQDCALAALDGAEAEALHAHAVALVDEAAEVSLAQHRFAMAAVCDLTRVRYVVQSHPRVTVDNGRVLREALDTVLAAAVYLLHVGFASSKHVQRRHFCAERSDEAFNLAFDLAARMGETGVVAQLVEMRSATPAVSSAAFSRPAVSASVDSVLSETAWSDGLVEVMAGDGRSPDAGEYPTLVVAAPPRLLLDANTVVLGDAFDVAEQRYGLVDDRPPVTTW